MLVCPIGVIAMTEEHRMSEYLKRGYSWPLEKMVPNTPGWRRIMQRRFDQVSFISLADFFRSIRISKRSFLKAEYYLRVTQTKSHETLA